MQEPSTSTAVAGHESVADVLSRASVLETTDWSAAIDLLTEANRAARADELEIALADLRTRSFPRLAAESAPPAATPAGGTAPPIGASGLPELAPSELTAAGLRAAMLDHGALLVRGAVEPDQTKRLAASIDQSFAARKLATSGGGAGRTASWHPLRVDPELEPGLARKWIRVGGGMLLCDAPRVAFELLELYTRLGLQSMVAEYLGGRPVVSANKCTLRRVGLDATGGWHQDGAFLGDDLRAVNLWLALTPCGIDAPGLDLVPQRFEHTLETGTGGSYFDWAVGDSVVEEAAGPAGVVRPQFAAGDLLVFDELFLHKTAVDPSMTVERYAIEMWCFKASAYPNGHVPLVW